MTSVTLVHREATFTVPVIQAITKCNLFRNNVILAATPYSVQSPVSLSIFQEFVSELEGKAVLITSTNFPGLQLLSEEFGFQEFSTQLSKFSQPSQDPLKDQHGNPFSRVRSESFQFIVNGSVIEIDISEAVALFPAVREQLSVDGSALKFFVNDSGIEATDIRSLQLLLSGEEMSIRGSEGLLSKLLGNVSLELLFLGRSKAENGMKLSELTMERWIDLESADLSVEALDSLLLSESISIESEDALLRLILNFDQSDWELLRHIQIKFLSRDGLSLLDEHFWIPPESVWECAAERFALPSPIDRGRPGRPASPFLLFAREKRPALQAANPGLRLPEIVKKIGEQWKALSPSERAVYEQKASNMRAGFKASRTERRLEESDD
jgi:hypothetical protein